MNVIKDSRESPSLNTPCPLRFLKNLVNCLGNGCFSIIPTVSRTLRLACLMNTTLREKGFIPDGVASTG